ncbi:Tetratricopeptide-like helical [Penicillium viridicatum]|nr:Tetratricopeptide-like helical [Penicillium viridicatum]
MVDSFGEKKEREEEKLATWDFGTLLSGCDGAKEALAKFVELVEAESALVGAETLTELKGGFARVNSDMTKISRQLEETRVQTEMTRQERITANLRRLLQPSTSPEDTAQ